jgi:dTDP-4-dehydrorhamnose 3,5-epimerase
MSFEQTKLEGVIIYTPKVFNDERGYFFESYNAQIFNASTKGFSFVQDNEASSTHGVIRGLHYQQNPHAQTKLLRVLQGVVLDVVVDLRKGSPTYLQHIAVELSADNKKQILVPRGFAHGYSVLSETALVMYKCDNFYNKESEGGINPLCTELNINWQIDPFKIKVSDKDKLLPQLSSVNTNFTF